MVNDDKRHDIDLLIRINAGHKDSTFYPVEAWVEDSQGIRQHFDGGHFYFPPDQELHLDAEAYGLALYYALFSGPIMQAYDFAQTLAQLHADGRHRIRLWIHAEAAELHNLLWERMHYPYQQSSAPFAARANVPFSRYIDVTQSFIEPDDDRIVKMLYAIASPADVDRFGLSSVLIEEEIHLLRDALKDLIDGGRLAISVMPGHKGLPETLHAILHEEMWDVIEGPTTLETILHVLSSDQGYHFFHFLGHGRFSRSDSATMLYLEGRSGNAHIVRDQDVAMKIASLSNPPHMVFMSACETSRHAPQSGNPYIGFAPTLIQAGIPAVIVMQDRLPVDTSQQLTKAFYRYLLDDGIIDQAMSQSRLLLHSKGQQAWDVPVLFMRLEKGLLLRRDPILAVLNRMWTHDTFNPLMSESEYIPLEVIQHTGGTKLPSISQSNRERKPNRDALLTLMDLLDHHVTPATHEDTELPPVVVVSGDAGMGKSILLRTLGKMVIQQSLEVDDLRAVLPLYVDLQDYSQVGQTLAALEKGLWESMLKFWPELSYEKFIRLCADENGPTLCLLIDSADILTELDQHRLWLTLERYIKRYPHHKFVLTYNTNLSELPLKIDEQANVISEFAWGSSAELLMLQPVTPRTVEWYLYGQGEVGIALYQALDEGQLYNVAESPWVLNLLLQKARQGSFPLSLTQVLRDLFDESIFDAASSQGLRIRAAQSLFTIAWEMQHHFSRTLSLDKVFEIMSAIRGNRRYDLEALFAAFLKSELIATDGEDNIRFARSMMQSYCCAQALLSEESREHYLDDITATLGRRRRFYWWSEPLTLLAGLGYDPSKLIRQIIYGMESGAGEQILLAAMIVQECGWQNVEKQVVNHLVQTLIYYLNNRREPRVWRRIQLAVALGNVRHPDAIPHLVGVANQRVRLATIGREREFEESDVRLAAVLALRKIAPSAYDVIKHIDHELANILTWWDEADVMELGQYLVDADHLPQELMGSQAIAAFALGDLHTIASVDILISLFLYPYSSEETYRHLATALTLVDPLTVENRVILPLIHRNHINRLEDKVWAKREQYLNHIISLAGRIYTTDPRIIGFIRTSFLSATDVHQRCLAIQSLGKLQDVETKSLIEEVALGEMQNLDLPESVTYAEKMSLQKYALEALYYLGDDETLRRFLKRPASWSPEFERILYWTSEEILWREEMSE